MAPRKTHGGVSSSSEYSPSVYSQPEPCINIPGDPHEGAKKQYIQQLINENCVCKIIENVEESYQIIKTLRKIAGFDLCGCHINIFRGSCYINKKKGGGCFRSCKKQPDIYIPEQTPYQKPEFLQLFYKNNGITLHNFLIQKKDEEPLDFYIEGLKNIAEGIQVLQKKKYSHGYINLDNILITKVDSRTLMLLINLDKAEFLEEAEPNPIDVFMLGTVIKDILENFYPLSIIQGINDIMNYRHNVLHRRLKTLAVKMYNSSIEISEVIELLQKMYDDQIDFDVKGSYPQYDDKIGLTEKDDDLYEILELKNRKNSTPLEIRKKYRDLALINHPDKNSVNKELFTETMKKINNAYSILSNPTSKNEYDRKIINRGGQLSRKSQKPATKTTGQLSKQPAKQSGGELSRKSQKPATKTTGQLSKQPAKQSGGELSRKSPKPATKTTGQLSKQPAKQSRGQPAKQSPKTFKPVNRSVIEASH
jgi:hypothetical protein